MKKTKKDMAIHATIIGIIVIILIVSVVKLVKWNQGSEDAGEVITDENFDTGIVKTIEWYLGKYGVNR